jgi:hypothetical protein
VSRALNKISDIRGTKLREAHVSIAETVSKKLLSKSNIDYRGDLCEAALLEEVSSVVIRELLQIR